MARLPKSREHSPSSFLMTGKEIPISKVIKPTQIYTDYRTSPLRTSGNLVLNANLPKPSRSHLQLADRRPLNISLAHKGIRADKLSCLAKTAELTSSGNKTMILTDFNSKLGTTLRLVPPAAAHLLENPVLRCKSENKLKKSSRSTIPSIELNSNSTHLEQTSTENRVPDHSFAPYTLKDYRKIKNSAGKRTGGLGPSSVGSADWAAKVLKMQKMEEYSHKVSLPKLITYQDRSKSCVRSNLS